MAYDITEAKEKRLKFLNDAEAITSVADKEKRPLNTQEEETVEGYLQAAESLTDEIKAAEESLAKMERLENIKAKANKEVTRKIQQERSLITAIPDWLNDPKAGYQSEYDFYLDVLKEGKNRQASEKLRILSAVGSDEQSGLNDPYGGFLVPEGFSPDLLSLSLEGDPTTGRTADIPMTTSTLHLNALVDKTHTSSVSGGLTVSRRAETAAAVASRQEYEQVILRAVGLFGLVYVTEEIMEDSIISMAAILQRSFSNEFMSKRFGEKIEGTGAGEPEGVLNSAAKIAITRNTSSDIKYVDIVTMRSRCYNYSQAIWIANHDTYPKLAQMASADNAHIWQPSAREDSPDMLLGRPIFFSEYAKSIGTEGDLILCNWSQYLVGNYKPLRNASSIHVRFVNHERTFKWWLRDDGRLWWTSVLTPKYGATMSPIVVIAA